jgi:hypothetical protein
MKNESDNGPPYQDHNDKSSEFSNTSEASRILLKTKKKSISKKTDDAGV